MCHCNERQYQCSQVRPEEKTVLHTKTEQYITKCKNIQQRIKQGPELGYHGLTFYDLDQPIPIKTNPGL